MLREQFLPGFVDGVVRASLVVHNDCHSLYPLKMLSEAWGGCTSDKHLTENCGFLDKVLPGDTVMADRGFTISESVGLKHGKLVIPAFTEGKSQLQCRSSGC